MKECSAACPFCGAVVSTTACLDSKRTAPHVSRSALFVSASIAVAVSNCGAYGGSCPAELDLESPCGFLLVESTCSDGVPTCKKNGAPTFTTCKVVPQSFCTITVMLGDGTEQTVTVKVVNQCVTPGFVSFASATCTAPMSLDAGTDASDANIDDANDATDAMTADAPD